MKRTFALLILMGFAAAAKAQTPDPKAEIRSRFQSLRNEPKSLADDWKAAPWLQFAGTAEAGSRRSNVQGDGTQLAPPNYDRLLLNSTLTLKGVPLSVRALQTTEQSPLRQNMNYFSVSLDAEQLRRNILERAENRKKELTQTPQPQDVRAQIEKKAHEERDRQIESLKGKIKNEKRKRIEKQSRKLDKQNERLEKLRQRAAKEQNRKKPDPERLKALRDSIGSLQKDRRQTERSLKDSLAKYQALTKDPKQALADRLNKGQGQGGLGHKRDSVENLILTKRQQLDKIDSLTNKDPRDLADQKGRLDSLQVASRIERFLLDIKSLSIGTSFPQISELTLWGAPVTGAAFEYAPKRWRFAAVGSKNLKALDRPEGTAQPGPVGLATFARNLVAASVGYGDQDSSHLHLNFAHGIDDHNSVVGSQLATFNLKPRQNAVLSADFKFPLPKQIIDGHVEGEFGTALTANDVRNRRINAREVGSWISLNDYRDDAATAGTAFSLGLLWKIDSLSDLKTSIRRIEPGYLAMGVPFLRNDCQTARADLNRWLWNRRINLMAHVVEDRTNLRGWAPLTLRSKGAGAGIAAQPAPGLSIQIDHAILETRQRPPAAAAATVDSDLSQTNAAAAYAWKIKNLGCQTALTASRQARASSNRLIDAATTAVQLQHSLTFAFPLTLTAAAGSTWMRSSVWNTRMTNLGTAAAWSPGSKITLSLSQALDVNPEAGTRWTLAFDPRIELTKNLALQARAEFSSVTLLSGTSLQAFTANAALILNW